MTRRRRDEVRPSALGLAELTLNSVVFAVTVAQAVLLRYIPLVLSKEVPWCLCGPGNVYPRKTTCSNGKFSNLGCVMYVATKPQQCHEIRMMHASQKDVEEPREDKAHPSTNGIVGVLLFGCKCRFSFHRTDSLGEYQWI